MPIVATCSHCHATFEANDRLADKKIRCPKCGEVIRISSGAATPGATTFRGAPALSRNLMDDAEIPIKDPLADRAAHSLARKKFRRRLMLWSVLLTFVAIIGVGIYIAYQKVQTMKMPVAAAGGIIIPPPPLADQLHWSTFESPNDWSIQFPDVPQESSADGTTTIWLDGGPDLGRFLVEVRQESNAAWNNLTGQISVEEAKREVNSANLLSVADRRSLFATGYQVHRIRLTGDIPMQGSHSAITYKFSVDGATYTILWQGKTSEAGSQVVRHFFVSFQRKGAAPLSG
ncbi:zinc-ribbon domain-containing protein [Blastopirellula sp. J2-11]|uniref:zinc-ribbon domain-containing protein n=1 Tax=Blastopirellula sp. J2-11 TaxID=2943192 RepID=UPI0021C97AB8|nr:zinc-ribbon domain-containing protein [Blastopirellula sp. J2-11]UUO06924.1 zinc-ribbon domain-containing protein [Blastopirellula sp. J2-11]